VSAELAGKVVLLTGASGGIGSLTARALAAGGADLIAHYRSDRDGAEAAVEAIPAARRLLLQGDLSAPGSSRALWREAVAWRGRIDAVVVNAATLARTPFDGTDEDWDDGWAETMRVNVIEPASLIREALAHFLEHGGGTIVTISSWAAQAGSALTEVPAYAASKAAIRNLTQTVARNYARDGVLAYVVAPGIVRTPMAEISAEARGGIDKVHAALAMGELVPPEEVAELVAFLASGRVRHLTGATLDMNGASYVR
jgi:NAD(P)-dependent dehydrogenase (short-subunit alcohol dehydrogenase family)